MIPNFDKRDAIPMEGELFQLWTRLAALGFDGAKATLVDNAVQALSSLDPLFSRTADLHATRTQDAINNMDVYRRRLRGDLLRILGDDDGSRLAKLIRQKGPITVDSR